MDWHSILETTFLVLFWVGLILTVVMAVMSGAFEHEFGSGSSFEGGVAPDLGGPDVGGAVAGGADGIDSAHPEVGWSGGGLPSFSPWSPTVLFAAMTGVGGIGYLAISEWDLGYGLSVVLALVGGLGLGGATFGILAWAFTRLQSTSHVIASETIGRKALVTTAIGSGVAGAVTLEAGGGRIVFPARTEDAAVVPEGAEVEIVHADGAVYVVRETRESWLRRSKETTRG